MFVYLGDVVGYEVYCCFDLCVLIFGGVVGCYFLEYYEVKGGCDFFECCCSFEIVLILILQFIECFGGFIDVVIIFFDILVIFQVMGMIVEMVDKKGFYFFDFLQIFQDKQYIEFMECYVDVVKELDYVYKVIILIRKKFDG